MSCLELRQQFVMASIKETPGRGVPQRGVTGKEGFARRGDNNREARGDGGPSHASNCESPPLHPSCLGRSPSRHLFKETEIPPGLPGVSTHLKKYVPFVGTKGTKNPRDGSLSKLCSAKFQRAVNSLRSNIRRDNTCLTLAFARKAKKLLTNPEP